jgi:hypothetical protein
VLIIFLTEKTVNMNMPPTVTVASLSVHICAYQILISENCLKAKVHIIYSATLFVNVTVASLSVLICAYQILISENCLKAKVHIIYSATLFVNVTVASLSVLICAYHFLISENYRLKSTQQTPNI